MITKAEGPDDSLALGEDADPALSSYLRLMRLKRLYRQGWLKRGMPAELCESVAEHSFGTALLALLLAPTQAETGKEGGGLDRSRAALMALVHEIGEAYAGDITPVDGISGEEKFRLEKESILRSLAGHPDMAWFLDMWEDFEKGASPEARYVRELDRLEMGLQAAIQNAEGHRGMEEFFASARRSVSSPRLRLLLEAAIAASSPQGNAEAPTR